MHAMHKTALLMTTCLLAACAGGQDAPPPSIAYVPATNVLPEPTPATAPVPLAPGNPIKEPKVTRHRSHEAATRAARRGANKTALDCGFEGAIMTCNYQHGHVYRVVVDAPSAEFENDADVTTLTLGPDERGETPDISQGGDANWFLVERMGSAIDETSMRARKASELSSTDVARARTKERDGGIQTVLTVKCYSPGKRSTLTVGTGRRKYIFDLRCANAHGGDSYNIDVAFSYLFDRTVSTPRRDAPSQAGAPAPVVADNRYEIEGPEEWRPREWSAWNDGANTHVRPAPSVQSRPTPLLPPGGGFYVDPATNQYVITGLPPEIRFPWGDAALIVRRLP